jgi:hypothetical protein
VAILSILSFTLVALTVMEVNWWGPSWHGQTRVRPGNADAPGSARPAA